MSIDLHVHTTASDGTCAPAEVVRLAREAGLSALAVTDHDTTAGVPEAQAAAEGTRLRVIPGIEISADYLGCEVHVLGYFLDPDAASLQEMLDWMVAERRARNQALVQQLAQAGMPIDLDELVRQHPGATVGRVHIAKALMAGGYVASVNEAFSRLIGQGAAYYVPRRLLPFSRAVQVIAGAGGLSALAHPLQYQLSAPDLEALLRTCKDAGVTGLEADYAAYTPAQRAELHALAADHGLLPTGGTDFHGANRPQIALGRGRGDLTVADSVLEALEERWKSRSGLFHCTQ